MLKKTLVLLTVVVLLVGIMIVPASAARIYFDFTDCIESWETIGDLDRVWIDIPKQNLFVSVRDGSQQLAIAQNDPDGATLTFDVVAGKTYSLLFGVRYLWLENIPNYTGFHYHPRFSYSGVDYSPVDLFFMSNFSNEYGTAMVYQNNEPMMYDFEILDNHGTAAEIAHNGSDDVYAWTFGYSYRNFIPKTSGKITLKFTSCSMEIGFPAGYMEKLENESNAIVAKKNYMLLQNQQALLEELESEQAITNDKLDQMPGEIGDEMESIIDKENQAASDAGDSAANELLDIIPNESDGFIDAIGSLVNSMSYNGTDAVLPVPSIALPEIPGVMSAVKLTDKQEVDFGFWIQKLPSNILQLVRILCTIALIVYCFKELYSTISYALTLKGGKSDE